RAHGSSVLAFFALNGVNLNARGGGSWQRGGPVGGAASPVRRNRRASHGAPGEGGPLRPAHGATPPPPPGSADDTRDGLGFLPVFERANSGPLFTWNHVRWRVPVCVPSRHFFGPRFLL